ncbi:MAG: hypothetical protein K6A40_07755 [Solobacterium sp.]|nr:hypothetical protein [Solobacterium sp.]
MKKLLTAALAVLLAAGCSANKPAPTEAPAAEVSGLKIATPTGAPALSLIPVIAGAKNDVTVMLNGAADLQAAFIAPTPAYDVIVAPTNLGVTLASKGKTPYRLLAVVDWGNLYIVGNSDDALSAGHKVAYFGETSVPGLVFKKAYSDIAAEVLPAYNKADEVIPVLLKGDADAGLLAEPAVTAAMAKAKEQNKELKVISSVQEKWGKDGFPMAALFVNSETYSEKKDVYEAMLKQMSDYASAVDMKDTSALVADIDKNGAEYYGVPSSAIVGKCYDRMNIRITKASECKDQIAQFMEIFGVTGIDGAFAE